MKPKLFLFAVWVWAVLALLVGCSGENYKGERKFSYQEAVIVSWPADSFYKLCEKEARIMEWSRRYEVLGPFQGMVMAGYKYEVKTLCPNDALFFPSHVWVNEEDLRSAQ